MFAVADDPRHYEQKFGDVLVDNRACVLVFNTSTYDHFVGCAPISEWLKTLCEKSKLI